MAYPPMSFPAGVGLDYGTGQGLQPTPNNPNPPIQSNLQDIISKIFSQYQPEHTALDQYNQLIQNYPQRGTPTRMQNILGFISGLGTGAGPGTYWHGTPVGFKGGSPKDILQAEDLVRFRPYYQQLGDWENQVKPFEYAANLERQNNLNQRQIGNASAADAIRAFTAESQDTRRQAQTEQGGEKLEQGWSQLDINKQNADTRKKLADITEWDKTHPNFQKIIGADGSVWAMDPKTGDAIPVTDADNKQIKAMGELQKAQIRLATQSAMEGIRETNREKMEGIRQQNRVGLIGQRYQQQVQHQGDIWDAQTKTMVNGSRMLLAPNTETGATVFDDLRNMSNVLAKNGLFGPAQSRIRELAAKIGTTGSPEEVEKNFKNFADAVASDPDINTDALVGEFTTTLGLLASGVGRVHGGARGGGSIEMIKYMKNLLSSDSSLPMFKARLDAVEHLLRKYAAGPPRVEPPKEPDALDKILSRIPKPKGQEE